LGRRAYVIDDEPSIRLALRRFLARDGWQVEEAADGWTALGRLAAAGKSDPDFDVIICDLRMPGCSGAELHDWLRINRPDLLSRLIVATGDAVSPEAADFVQRTASPVLQKPFELTELRLLMQHITTVG
jgi:CheY-like chemotaxis protein